MINKSKKDIIKKSLQKRYGYEFRKNAEKDKSFLAKLNPFNRQKRAELTEQELILYADGKKKKVATIAAFAFGAYLLLTGGISVVMSGFSVVSGISTGVYHSKPADIDQADLIFSEKEADLQKKINNIEKTYPGYDEYAYNLDQIGHNPFTLINYLSAEHKSFTDVESEVVSIFNESYSLTITPKEEQRTREGEDGEEQYTAKVLHVTLKRIPLEELLRNKLSDGGKKTYDVLDETKGLLQQYKSPLKCYWYENVSWYYGYRINPETNKKEFHRGIDISVPEGTSVYAAQDGKVTAAGFAGDFGNYVEITGEKGYVSKYAHLSTISVTKGQSVKAGDLIGLSGSTGSEMGSSLHLECMVNGEYYNPLFYFEVEGTPSQSSSQTGGGSGGSSGGVMHYDIPPDALKDKQFAGMINEAEKYIGRAYVWGGSSPETGFDCSGFVSWVINHSGNGWNVGRQSADGLLNNCCAKIPPSEAKPGDLIFFEKTYNTTGASHVGIYVGNNTMLHCGDPISYEKINTSYWQQHFYTFGRIKR